jgi:hypothetical protein
LSRDLAAVIHAMLYEDGHRLGDGAVFPCLLCMYHLQIATSRILSNEMSRRTPVLLPVWRQGVSACRADRR